MKCFILISFLTLAFAMDQNIITSFIIDLFRGPDENNIDSRIIGGNEAIPHQFPYQAALIIKSDTERQFCGGSIISDQYILTAAHCLNGAKTVDVILGAHNIYKNEGSKKFYQPSEYFVHEKWNSVALIGDVALVKLPYKTKFNKYIKPINLPRYSDAGNALYGKRVIVSGWGRTSDEVEDLSPVLRYIKPLVISQVRCELAFVGIPNEQHICISGTEGTSICGGDSGGPLVTMDESGTPTLRGIASFGFGSGCRFSWPAVFTRVSSYLDWIHNRTGICIRD